MGNRYWLLLAMACPAAAQDARYPGNLDVVGNRAGKTVTVLSPRLDGDAISFILVDHDDAIYRKRFEGKASGRTMEGTARGDPNAPRSAFKVAGHKVGMRDP